MVSDSELAARLASFVLPLMAFWFITGFVITVMYHLSLYFIEGEFHAAEDLTLDLALTALRIPLFFIAWPAVLYFDRTALHRIKLFWNWLDPKAREKDEELQDFLRMRAHRELLRKQYEEELGHTLRRDREAATRKERDKRLRRLSADNPELGGVWLLVGTGGHAGGARQLVRRYPDALLPSEIVLCAEDEVKASRPWNCLRCREPLKPSSVRLPEPFFLRIVEHNKTLVEGWAFEGRFEQQFAPCPRCGAEQPAMTGEMTSFGRADEVLTALESGISFAETYGPEDRPEMEPTWRKPTWTRILNFKARKELKVWAGLVALACVLAVVAVFAWAVLFMSSYYGGGGV